MFFFDISSVRLLNLRESAISLGAATGSICGIPIASIGIFVIPMVPFLQTLHFKKEEMIQALGISFTLSAISLALRLALHGQYSFGFLGCPSV